jgi:hypothetical protein
MADPDQTADAATRREAGGTISDGERKRLLKRAVQELSREFRASVRRQDEFEVLLVRGHPVDNRRHLVLLASVAIAAIIFAMLAAAASTALSLGLGMDPLGMAVVIPGVYALWWLFLAGTGGEELERISVDEQGNVHSAKWGRPIETRGNFLRLAVPGLVAAVSGSIAGWLIYMIIYPPFPRCTFGDPSALPEVCSTFPSFLGGGGGIMSVAETQRLETIVRLLPLAVDVAIFLPAIACLWCMSTGHYFLGVRPVRRQA